MKKQLLKALILIFALVIVFALPMSAKDYKTGDMDNDGEIVSNDAIYLLRHVLLPEKYPVSQSADLNGDGKITTDDAISLLRHTIEPETYPIVCAHNYVDGVCTRCGDGSIPAYSEGLAITSNGDGTCYVSGIGTCKDTDIVIPTTSPAGDKVTGIGANAFRFNYNVKSITIPNGVTSIGNMAFYLCESLTSVTIPNGVTSIGNQAFFMCTGLTRLTIPDSVTSIGNQAFYNCNNLVSVTIGSSVTSIGSNAFNQCHKLVEVINKSDLDITKRSSENGDVAGNALEVHSGPSKVVNKNDYLFYTYDSVNYLLGYVGEDTDLILPENYNGQSYQINPFAFYDDVEINSVVLSSCVTHIGINAFAGCIGLQSITADSNNPIYSSVDGNLYSKDGSKFVQYALGKADESFTIPDGVTSIGSTSFAFSPYLINVTIPDSVKTIESNALIGCESLTSIIIPDSVTNIGVSAFSGCSNLVSITIGKNVESLNYCFNQCYKLVEVINKSALDITKGSSDNGKVAYYALEVHNGDSKIVNNNGYLFYRYEGVNYLVGYESYREEWVLPTSFNGQDYVINDYAFVYNYLESLIIPESVIGIGKYAFEHANIWNLTFSDTKNWFRTESRDDFENRAGGVETDVTNASSNATYLSSTYTNCYWYKKVEGSTQGFKYFSYGNGTCAVSGIGDCTDADLYIPTTAPNGDAVIAIRNGAFLNCESIKSITIPRSVVSIGAGAFNGCSNLEQVIFKDMTTWYHTSDYYNLENKTGGTEIVVTDSFENANYLKNTYGWDYWYKIDDNHSQGLQFTSNGDGTCYLSGIGTCKDTDIVIPNSSPAGDKVIAIGSQAFYYEHLPYNGIKSVTIPISVTSIGSSAFSNCTSLTSVTIPDSVTSIGSSAFSNCTSLTSVTIPDSVTSIGNSAFYKCTALEKIYFNAIVMNDLSSDNDVFSYAGQSGNGIQVIIGKNVTKIPAYLFCPDVSSFHVPMITSVEFAEESVCERIGCYAFAKCENLKSMIIPDSVTSIGDAAFAWCDSLTSVTIGDGVTIIGERAFGNCSDLSTVTIGDSVTNIEDGAFSCCNSLESVYIADIATWCNISFGDYYDTNPLYYAKSLYVNNELVTDLVIPSSVTSIGNSAFYNCTSLTSVTIENSVTSIGDKAFYNCDNLMSVTIGNGVTNIGYDAFYSCDNLTSVTIPDNIISIDATAFSKCYNIEYNIYDNAKYLGNEQNPYIFLDSITDKNIITYEIHPDTKIIKNEVFSDCISLKDVTIPNGVTSIGNGAFYGCEALESVTIPDSVTSLGYSVFYNCTELTSVTIGNSVTSIGAYAFLECDSLENVTIPDSVTSIGEWAFAYCDSLTSVTIGDSVTSIGNYAFRYCTSLTSVTIPYGVTSIGEYAFDECKSLESVTIPISVTSIERYTFYGCSKLESVMIPAGVTSIGEWAFYGCTSLTSIIFEGTGIWYRTSSSSDWQNMTGGTETDVTNSSTNATNFKSTYRNYYWYKK